MCEKKQFKYCPSEIDECMIDLINALESEEIKVYACCCGHGRYPMTIILKSRFGGFYDMISRRCIKRKKKFYKKDSEGYYYIPEVKNGY